MALKQIGTMGDLVRGATDMVDRERQAIIDWLRAHEGQDERAIAAGACVSGSTMHGELRDEAGYYCAVADALEAKTDWAWLYGLGKEEWLSPPERTGG